MSVARTRISWTERTWNPIRGCTKVSEGCRNCYAEEMARRFSGPGRPFAEVITDGTWNDNVMLVKKDIYQPTRWRKPSLVFVASMSDPLHKNVPDEWLSAFARVMRQSAQHEFQMLTKRPERLVDVPVKWSDNVWVGVSVESAKHLDRVDHLRSAPVDGVRWISAEPLLGPLPDMDLTGIDWVVVGGESGGRARPMDINWVRDIVKQCRQASVPVFVKQLGTVWGKENLGRHIKADKLEEWPEDLRVQEYPQRS